MKSKLSYSKILSRFIFKPFVDARLKVTLFAEFFNTPTLVIILVSYNSEAFVEGRLLVLFSMQALLICSCLSIVTLLIDSYKLNVIHPSNVNYYYLMATASVVEPSDTAARKTAPKYSPYSDHIWWDLFKSHPKSKEVTNVPNNNQEWAPMVDAWRTAFRDPQQDTTLSPPCSLQDYLDGSYVLCSIHSGKIVELWNIIRTQVKFSDELGQKQVIEALNIAYIALWGKQTTRSLEESINRAVGVASVLGELNADANVVIAGILHDVIDENQHNDCVIQDFISAFGIDVVTLAQQYARLPKFMARKTDYTLAQSENQLQMLVTLAEDYRCLYIRIADRLHALRVLPKLPLDALDQKQIALEAQKVYSPLAHKMGIIKVRDELEDLAFQVLDPEMFQRAEITQIAAHKAYQDACNAVQDIISTDQFITSANVQLHLSHRIKAKYQLYKKMLRKGLQNPSEVRDALGLRLIIDTPRQAHESSHDYESRNIKFCYYVVDQLRSMPGWEPTENGFKDYIFYRKINGYQSLHQYIHNIETRTNVEVQVRTKEMHIVAELGGAAHFSYKDRICRTEIYNTKNYRLAWRSSAQLNAKSSAELIGLAKRQLRDSRVFVYLDDMSTVINLQRGSTALDAAFQIHTVMGLCTKGIRIDGKSVPLDQQLKTGDIISVQCSANNEIQAKLSWLNQVTTTYASIAIKKHMKDNHKEMLLCLGLMNMLYSFSLVSDKLSFTLFDPKRLKRIIEMRTGKSVEDYLVLLSFTTKAADKKLLLSKLMMIPPADVIVTTNSVATLWVRMQGSSWENATVQSDMLIPMVREILPSEGFTGIEQKLIEIVGVDPLLLPSDVSAKDSCSVKRMSDYHSMSLVRMDEILNSRNRLSDDDNKSSSTRRKRPSVEKTSVKIKCPLQLKVLIKKPFSLQAPSLSLQLLKQAKYNFAQKALAEERRLNGPYCFSSFFPLPIAQQHHAVLHTTTVDC